VASPFLFFLQGYKKYGGMENGDVKWLLKPVKHLNILSSLLFFVVKQFVNSGLSQTILNKMN